MEALAVLRLSVSPRRSNNHGYLEDDVDEIALPTPYTSAPSSPRRAFTKEVEEAPLGEVRAAIPFAWELVPGTPKNEVPEVCVFSDETEETVSSQDHGFSTSSSSETSTESLSRESFNTEFEFSSRFVAEPAAPAPAEELFSNGQLVTSLRLPPRLQHLRNSDSFGSDVSSSGSFKSYPSPQSPRPGPLNLSSLCGFTKTTDEETSILGMQERRHRSLSPLRLLNRETYFSSDSSNSSVSSSSSSASSANAGSPQDSPAEKTSAQGSMPKELLFTDMAMASGRSENVKPRLVQSKRELLKKHHEQWNGFADAEKVGKPALTPQLSRSNARSRPAAIDIHVNSSRKENVGRAIFANRFGMLCSCLGMLPESP